MRFDVWTIVRFLHVGSAILWVGGQLTLSLVVRPVAAGLFDPDTRVDLVTALGARFGRIATVGLIPTLLASGLSLAYHRGVTLAALSLPGYGTVLGVKIFLALISFALAAAHGMAAVHASAAAVRAVAIAGATVSLAVVGLAVSLVP